MCGFRVIKILLWLWVSVFIPISALSMTLDELANSYSFDYSGGSINLLNYSDYMFDSTGSGANDTLSFNLTVNSTGNFHHIIVDLVSGDSVISAASDYTLPDGLSNVTVSFDSSLLGNPAYNYSVRIYDYDGNLEFRKDKLATRNYPSYKTAVRIANISDFVYSRLGINVTFNSSVAGVKEVAVYLIGGNKTIFSIKNVTFSNAIFNASFYFDNESIKSTHYNGTFIVDLIAYDNKLFDTNYSTNSYDYATFANLSYVRDVKSTLIDSNNNGLYDYLTLNVTLSILQLDNYSVSIEIYSNQDQFVTNLSKFIQLSKGTRMINFTINGSDLYFSGVDGPYVVKVVKIANQGAVIDFLESAHETNSFSHADFERPPLPDIILSGAGDFDGVQNVTQLMINVTNAGQAPAFNVLVDLFGSNGYASNITIPELNPSTILTYQYSFSNMTVNDSYVAVADMANDIDESNESNNADIFSVIYSIGITSVKKIYVNGTLNVFEFIIVNNGTADLYNLSWQADMGDGMIVVSSQNFSLHAGENIFSYVTYNYSSEGQFLVTVNVSSPDNISASASNSYALDVSNVTVLYDDGQTQVIEFIVQNNGSESLENINWTFDTGESPIYASDLFNLSAGENMRIFVAHTYSGYGLFNAAATAAAGYAFDNETAQIKVKALQISNLSVLNSTGTDYVIEFYATNILFQDLTGVSWNFDTGNNVIINSTQNISLLPRETAFVYVNYNFSNSGTFNINVSVSNNSVSDWANKTIVVT